MARHRSKTSEATAKADIDAASLAALAELKRRQVYEHLKYLEGRISEYPPVPGDPPYAKLFPDLDKS
jgi:hypothetical protein